ncbi:MFS transporter [Nonomuraea sp. NPDC003754]
MTQAAEREGHQVRRVVPLLAATGISVTGDGAFWAAAPLLAAEITRDPLAISLVYAAFYLPWLIIGLPAGALVDRWQRRRVMVIADLVRAVVLAGLAIAVLNGQASVPLLVATVLVVGIAQCFFDSAAQAIIPFIVGRDKGALAHVNGRFWSIDMAGRSLLGPPLGSASFAVSRVLPFGLDALSFLASAVLVRLLPNPAVADGPHEGLGSAVRAGLGHLVKTRELLILALSTGAYNGAFNVAMATFVLYATSILDIPNAVYGVLLAAIAVGGIPAGWWARPLTSRLTYRQTQSIALSGQAISWTGILLVSNVWVTGALFVIMGACGSMSSVAVASARQALTPDGLLGRVVAAFRLLGLGVAGCGALAGGALAHFFGLNATFIASSSFLLVAALLTWPFR